MVTTTKPRAKRRTAGMDRSTYDAAPDTGCYVSPRCTSCPLRVCIKEASTTERAEFAAAWKVLARYVAPPDRTIEP